MNNTTEYIEAIGRMPQHFHEMIDTMNMLNAKYQFPDHIKINLLNKKARAFCQKLNCAVIGNFSAGKSSVLNKLLGGNILPAKASVCTNTSVCLSKASNKTYNLKVVFYNDFMIEATDNDFSILKEHLEKFYYNEIRNYELTDLNQILSLVNSNKLIGDAITKIELEVPFSNVLLDKINLIDTPGLFAGSDEAEAHNEITENVIVEDADVALLLLPANQVITATTLQFLDALPKHFLEKVIFVISKIDSLENENELEEQIAFVKEQLKTKLNIEDSTILPFSINKFNGKDSNFYADIIIESILSEFYNNESTIKICTLSKLIEENTERIINYFQKRNVELSIEKKDLNKKLAPTLETILEIELSKLNESIESSKKELKRIYKRFEDCKLKLLDSSYSYCVSFQESVVDEGDNVRMKYETACRKETNEILSQINKVISNINTSLKMYSIEIKSRLSSNYQIEVNVDDKCLIETLKLNSLALPENDLTLFIEELEKQKNNNSDNKGAGAIGGAVIGGIILGPLGALIGGYLGSRTAGSVGRTSIGELQALLKSKLEHDIASNIISTEEIISKTVSSRFANLKKEIAKREKGILNEYSEEVKIILDKQKAKIKNITKSIQQIEIDMELVNSNTNNN